MSFTHEKKLYVKSCNLKRKNNSFENFQLKSLHSQISNYNYKRIDTITPIIGKHFWMTFLLYSVIKTCFHRSMFLTHAENIFLHILKDIFLGVEINYLPDTSLSGGQEEAIASIETRPATENITQWFCENHGRLTKGRGLKLCR